MLEEIERLAYPPDGLRPNQGTRCCGQHPNKANRTRRYRLKKALYRERNLIERFFNRIKYYRRVATRYEKLGVNFLAMVQLAVVRPWFGKI